MDLHPLPAAGQAKPWAFPVPERGALANGLTVLRCHRPGQQVVAVEICLDAPLDAEPDGLDGIATIMVNALSEGCGPYTPRSSPPSWSAAAPRSARTSTTPARASRWRCPPPACAGRSACSPRRCARPRSRSARSSGWCATVSTRSRTSWPTRPDARPSSCRRSCSRRRRGCRGRARAPRRPSRASTQPCVRAFYEAQVRPATATAIVVGDLTGVDLDAMLADTLGEWTGDDARPACACRR